MSLIARAPTHETSGAAILTRCSKNARSANILHAAVAHVLSRRQEAPDRPWAPGSPSYSLGHCRQSCGKASGGAWHARRPPARLRKGSGRLWEAPATAGKAAERLREIPGRPSDCRQGCGQSFGGSGHALATASKFRKGSGRLRAATPSSARLRKGSGRLRAALATAGKAAERLQEAPGSPNACSLRSERIASRHCTWAAWQIKRKLTETL